MKFRAELCAELRAELRAKLRAELRTELRAELRVELRVELRAELYVELRIELQGGDPLGPPSCTTCRIKLNINKKYSIALYMTSFYPPF
jgi:hypothetical protein